jgi:MYXO-CTERM domain-containing protein
MRAMRAAAVAAAIVFAAATPAVTAQMPVALGASAPARPASGSWTADLPLRRDSDAAGPAAVLPWLVVVLVALGGLWLVRRRRAEGVTAWPFVVRSGLSDAPVVLSARSLGPHASLQVVRWNGKEMLLGCTGHAITVLESRAAAPAPSEQRV